MDFRKAYDPVRALGVSWRLMRRAFLTVFVGAVLVIATEPDIHVQMAQPPWEWGIDLRSQVWRIPPFICGWTLIAFLLNCLLKIGFAGAVQRVMVTGEQRFKDLFQDRGLWFNMMLARLLKMFLVGLVTLPFVIVFQGPILVAEQLGVDWAGVAAGGLLVACYAPIWAYILLGFQLIEQAVAIESMTPMDALQRSWDLAEGNRVQLLGYFIVIGVFQLSGLILCGVGVFLTSAWGETARFESYLRFAIPEPEGGIWVDTGQGAGSGHTE